ncbi:hypothetical protein CPT_Mater86 [Bacillus phage Mater]|uniref:Uncharacterized protein n=1 Tax=Bacillus phage Mater TaxID=1540090 RepID=A0A0A0RUK1_9CAUD|nr:DNA binding protein [Bacillus phage Mater]AIW03243.1 hypothetical protein CPT_Mater86 [Bacillus phage Mater]
MAKNARIDITNDFTEEEAVALSLAPTNKHMPTLEEGVIEMYKAKVPVTSILKTYGLHTRLFYKILEENGVPLRSATTATDKRSHLKDRFEGKLHTKETRLSSSLLKEAPESVIEAKAVEAPVKLRIEGDTLYVTLDSKVSEPITQVKVEFTS